MSSIPHSPTNIVCKTLKPDVYLLLDPDTPNWIVVNSIGREIIAQCDGRKTVGDILGIICTKHDLNLASFKEDLLGFLDVLVVKRFVSHYSFSAPKIPSRWPTKLQEIWIHVTNTCNLHCIHCHIGAGLPLEDELGQKEINSVIHQFAELGGHRIVFSGGEPLIRRDLISIVQHGRRRGIKDLDVLTNGTLITRRIASDFKRLGIFVQVSLDGAKAKTNDFVRGKGAYQKTLLGIRKLVQAGVQARISMTVMKTNMSEIEEMVKLSNKLKLAESTHFAILQNEGQAKENKDIIGLTNDDIVESVRRIVETKQLTNKVSTLEKNYCETIKTMPMRDACGAGLTLLSLASNGDVFPCAGLHDDEFFSGNIRDQRPVDIWKKSEALQRFRYFSVTKIPECLHCEFKFICGGGCHVDKFSEYRRLDMASPRCGALRRIYWQFLTKEAIKDT